MDSRDYFTFGVDEAGDLYVDIAYIPTLPLYHYDPSMEPQLRKIFDATRLHKVISFEDFKLAVEQEEPWLERNFGNGELYGVGFEFIEEENHESVTPSSRYAYANLRYPIEYDGKYYSIYPHEDQD